MLITIRHKIINCTQRCNKRMDNKYNNKFSQLRSMLRVHPYIIKDQKVAKQHSEPHRLGTATILLAYVKSRS
jgi:hypothetical protein